MIELKGKIDIVITLKDDFIFQDGPFYIPVYPYNNSLYTLFIALTQIGSEKWGWSNPLHRLCNLRTK